jgi:hypothetical protein
MAMGTVQPELELGGSSLLLIVLLGRQSSFLSIPPSHFLTLLLVASIRVERSEAPFKRGLYANRDRRYGQEGS